MSENDRTDEGAGRPEPVIHARFESRLRRRLSRLVTPALIDEHAQDPTAEPSPALAVVLAAMRQAPVSGKRALLADPSGIRWRMITLSGDRDEPHEEADRPPFDSEHDALHAVFLQRLTDLGIDTGSDP